MIRTTAVVLAGGASRRMGIDKRAMRLFPESPTFLERTVAVGRAVADRVGIVGPPYLSADLPRVTLVPDRWPSEGPLGGLVTALEMFPDDRLLLLAGDYPLLQVGLAARLLDGLEGYDGSVAVDRERRHPLVAAYDGRRCAGIAASLFGAGERSMGVLVGLISMRLVDADVIDPADVHGLSLSNVNTPEDVHALRERCRSLDLEIRR